MTQTTEPPRPLAGLVLGAAMLAVVSVPVFWTGLFTLASFSGCFLSCGEPEPLVGLLWGGVTLLLLSLPALVGVGAARSRLPWTVLLALTVVLLGLAWSAWGRYL
jgi:hypothetical protein